MVGLAIGCFAFGTCQAGRASDAEIRLEAALVAQRDSASQWSKARQALTVRLGALQRDSSALARQYAAARYSAAQAHHQADSLLALVPESLSVGIRLGFDSLTAVVSACEAVLANCELRAQNAEARVRGDSTQLVRLVSLTDTLEAAWHREQRKNSPGFLGLRSFWHARSWTIPLAAVSTLLILTHH